METSAGDYHTHTSGVCVAIPGLIAVARIAPESTAQVPQADSSAQYTSLSPTFIMSNLESESSPCIPYNATLIVSRDSLPAQGPLRRFPPAHTMTS